jgi:glycosyltransferase involved in cell wall biosynthesis
MAQPLFTVVTITYNSSRWVRQAIESVLASSYTDFEYIISDDCSIDNTWEIIQQYKDSRIISWRNDINIGEYPNRNKALRKATGKFILYIDGDDILYNDALERFAKYLEAFPNAKGIWGVYPVYFDFVVLPYQFTPLQLTSLNYLSTYPVTVVGFAESLFSVEALLQIGGFDEGFAIGDTYIKRKFCCKYSVVLATAGFAYWRQYPEQASSRARNFHKQLTDTFLIDKEILWSDIIPLSEEDLKTARINFYIRTIKLVALNTLRKGKVLQFFKLLFRLKIPFSHFIFLFKKGNYSYKADTTSGLPLINNYHFKRSDVTFGI